MCADAQSVQEVVRALMASGASALIELKELRLATREILNELRKLDSTARNLAQDVGRVATDERIPPSPIVLAVQERVAFLSMLASQICAAFRELDRGMDGWGLDGFSSVKPNGSTSN